jgi:hypothetical protein
MEFIKFLNSTKVSIRPTSILSKIRLIMRYDRDFKSFKIRFRKSFANLLMKKVSVLR